MRENYTNKSNWFIDNMQAKISNFNEVQTFIDGENYMADLRNKILATTANDFIYATGWQFSIDQNLLGRQDLSSNFLDLLKSRANEQVNVKLLPWMPINIQQMGAQENINQHIKLFLKCWNSMIQVCLCQYNTFNGSHHQKSILVKNGNNIFAYLGGIDIASDRWDTNNHLNSPDRNRQNFYGWHDIHLRINGPASGDIYDNFKTRWNNLRENTELIHFLPKNDNGEINYSLLTLDGFMHINAISEDGLNRIINGPSLQGLKIPVKASNFTLVEQLPAEQPSSGSFDPSSPLYVPKLNNVNIQRLRTISLKSTLPILTQDKSILEGFRNAILKARHYIYLEDQYFWWSNSLTDAFKSAASRGVKIIGVTVKESDADPLLSLDIQKNTHHSAWKTNINEINGNNGQNVYLYHLDPVLVSPSLINSMEEKFGQIYVHSKLMIIDDIFVSVGSANLNDRSMTCDSELAVGIIDNSTSIGSINGIEVTVCDYARKLRIDLWSHHLNIPAPPENQNINEHILNDPLTNGKPTNWPDCYSSPTSIHYISCHLPSMIHNDIDPLELNSDKTQIESDFFNELMSPKYLR